MRAKLLALTVITVGFSALCWLGMSSEFFERFENQSWDWRLRIAAYRTPADQNIKVIELDQQTLDYYAEEEKLYWPLPRVLYGLVAQYVREAGAKGVAFDMLFTEYSRHGFKTDQAFAQMLAGDFPVVTAAEFRLDANDRTKEEDANRFTLKQRDVVKDLSIAKEVQKLKDAMTFGAATLPFSELLESAPALGNVAGVRDSDGVFRRHVPVGEYRSLPVLSLPFALYTLVNKSEKRPLALDEYLDAEGRLTLRYRGGEGPHAYDRYSFATVVSSMTQLESGEKPVIDPAEFKDAWVFVGPTAAALKDDRPTPLNKHSAGVGINATVLDNLLHRDFVKPLSLPANVFYSAAFIALATCIVLFVQAVRFQVCLVAALLVMFAFSSFVFLEFGYWSQMVVPFGGTMLALGCAFAFLYQLEGRERAFLKDAFSHYLSPIVIDRIITDPSSLALGGERRELSIFFSDIAGFTTISEQLDPRMLVKLLNKYLSALTDIVLENGGTLDKYEGDAIIAFWNAPLTIEDHAFASVKTALECQQCLQGMYPEFEKEFGLIPKTRIGINTGLVSVGNFGSQNRFDYTVIGEAANLAARLEGLNKVFGTPIMISEVTQRQIADRIVCRKIGQVRAAGVSQPVTVYEPLRVMDVQEPPPKGEESFETAILLFEDGDLEQALCAFKELTSDAVASAYVQRIEAQLKTGREQVSTVWDLSDKNFLALLDG